MMDRFRGARTRVASGRFLWLTFLVGCSAVGGPAPDPASPVTRPVVVAPGAISPAQESDARRLLAEARASFEARRFFEVLRTTDELLDGYAASEASGEALRLSAIAHAEVGQAVQADAAAERYVGLLPADDPRVAEMRLVQARALESDPVARLGRLLSIGDGAGPDVLEPATELLRSATDEVELADLERALDEATPGSPLLPLAEARLAVALLERGRTDEAVTLARRSLAGGVEGVEGTWARGVLEGELPPGRARVRTFTIGAVLPEGGPPALAQFAASIREGIELAVATVLGDDYTVTLDVRDDEGDPAVGATALEELEREGAVGVVGFLLDDVLVSAGDARTRPVPIVSPTARSAREAGEAVYSLEEADPDAARSIADYGARRAFQRVAMVYPNNPAARAEADAFAARAGELGMPVVGRFEYEPGATFFESQIVGARDALRASEIAALGLTEDDTLNVEMLVPAAVFMPLPPEDVEFIAPQVVHYGLDTLAIEVLGTSGWTDPPTLAAVDARLTDGVVATAPAGASADDEGPRAFRSLYQERYRRSLVSTAPAVGYDAALLLLEGLRAGRVEPEELRRELESLDEIRGATGIFTIRDGRIARRTDVVRIENRRLVPVEPPLSPSR